MKNKIKQFLIENKKLILISILIFLFLTSATYFLVKLATKQDVLEGEFISKRGVMDEVSCVCFNSGYVIENGIKTPVCIDSDIEFNCKKIKLTGVYKSINIKADMNTCNLENYKVFITSGIECLE